MFARAPSPQTLFVVSIGPRNLTNSRSATIIIVTAEIPPLSTITPTVGRSWKSATAPTRPPAVRIAEYADGPCVVVVPVDLQCICSCSGCHNFCLASELLGIFQWTLVADTFILDYTKAQAPSPSRMLQPTALRFQAQICFGGFRSFAVLWLPLHTRNRYGQCMRVPLWMPACFFSRSPPLVYTLRVRKLRKRHCGNLCLVCGYDFRSASTNRCPECGIPIASGQARQPSVVNRLAVYVRPVVSWITMRVGHIQLGLQKTTTVSRPGLKIRGQSIYSRSSAEASAATSTSPRSS